MDETFPETEKLQLDGTTLAYQEIGEGEPVVLVHGGVSDLRTWRNQIPVLGKQFRVIAYSRRFARPNEPIQHEANDPMQPHVDDLIALMKKKEAAPAHLIGHSWGGFITLMAAIQHPAMVSSLILIEPPVLSLFVDVPPKPTQLLRLLFSKPRMAFAILKLGATAMGPAEKAFRRGDDAAAIEAFGRGVLGKDRFARLSPERYAQVWENRGPDRAQMLGGGFPPLSKEQVSTVNAPTLLVSGRESPKVFHRLNENLSHFIPQARSVTIADASHIVHEDASEEFNKAILGFLNKF